MNSLDASMGNLNIGQKCIEVRIRTLPNTERSDRKDVSRVFLSMDTLLDLRIEAGQPCSLWKAGEVGDDAAKRKEAIAWPSAQKINKNVMQMFKTFQDHCGFRLEDTIAVTTAGPLMTADTVVLRDVTAGKALEEKDKEHWEWYLEDKLFRAESIFANMQYEIVLKGRRTFVVEAFLIEGRPLPNLITHFSSTSRVKIIDESADATVPVIDGPRPNLEVRGIAGVDLALKKLNDFLAEFNSVEKSEPNWGQRACGLLLHGANGVGKSLLLDKVAACGWGKVFRIETDMKVASIRDCFKEARLSAPSIILIDDLDQLAYSEANKLSPACKALNEEMDRISMDSPQPKIVILAATTSLAAVPRQLRKRGRFTTNILLSIPDTDARKAILRSLAPKDLPVNILDLLAKLGERTHAYTPEDLALLLDAACSISRRRHRLDGAETAEAQGSASELTPADIDAALLAVRPSAMHDVTLQPPKIRWSEIGGQHGIKAALQRAVEVPMKHPELLRRLGAVPKKGLLLYGPPGCSKTLSAAAMATEAGFNFFAVKGAELLNMYVGESERAVRDIFAKARAAAPAIIFFDEIESIGSKREGKNGGVNVLTTLLNEMDGIEALKGVTVLAATNKPESLDLALLRPGRFDELLYVAPPDFEGRKEILEGRRRKMDWEESIDTATLALKCEGYSGAEIVAITQTACDRVIERALETGDMKLKVTEADMEYALGKVKKQITGDMVEGYKNWARGLGGGAEII